MNKHLLSLLIIFCFGFVNSQNPSGCKIIQTPMINYSEVQPQNNISVNPILINHKKNISNTKTNAVATVTVTRFTGSMNVFGVLISESNSLCYNPGPNIISFVHRKSPTYTPAANGNSGSIVTMYSNNLGAGWDSTCIWANSTDLARYPQGGIYNPLGNTTYTNAYAVGMGAITNGTVWTGNFYASKKLTAVGNTTPGIDQQSMLNASLPVGVKSHHYSRNSFSSIDGSYVRSMSSILNDPAGATNVAYGARGAMMTKGLFTAGSFSWTTDSFAPSVTLRTDGSKQINPNAIQAWSENGVTGYVVLYGCRAGAPLVQKGYQPLVYKTTNGGATWALLPGNDFTTPNFYGLTDRLKPLNTNSTVVIPQFSQAEGFDAAVDLNGNLHLVTTVVGTYSSHQDSLDYGFTFTIGGENYTYDYSPVYGKPTIYDFYTKTSGGWCYHIVDTTSSEGPSGTVGQPGFTANPWFSSAVDLNARIQISRTADGKKLFYSWTGSDPAIAGNNWNVYPNIRVKGYEVSSDKVTLTYSVTDGTVPNPVTLTGVDGLAYFHYMSDKAIGSSTACVEIPFTSSNNSTNDGAVPVDHYYIKGQSICPNSFTIMTLGSNCLGVGIETNISLQNNLSISPNPSNGQFTIGNLQNQSLIEVFDITGRLILKEFVNENSAQIDLSDKQKGIYFYRVIDKNNNAQQGKLIVE